MAPDNVPKGKWYLTRPGVIFLLFFVLGPLGLPLLFRSPGFSKTWKIVLTAAVIVYTVYLVFVSLKIATGLYENIT